jgi:TolB protein
MRKQLIIVLLLSTFFTSLFAVDAQMEIVKKGMNLPKISVNVAYENQNNELLNKTALMIENDLKVSGHFDVVSNKFETSFTKRPNFVTLREQNVDLFVNINMAQSSFSAMVLNVKVYDANAQNLVINQSFSTSNSARYPFLAHRTAIAINDFFKAPSIAWMDKFVIFARYLDSKQSEIVIADYTLSYENVMIKGGLNIFPKWANKEQDSFYYTTYNRNKPTLVKANLFTGQTQDIVSSDGMIVCSDVSSDGKKLLLTMSPNDQADIYLFDTQSKIRTKLTNYSGIDVGGSFIENDSKIVFVSDRLQYPNIFAKKIGARAVERLVYHGRNNSSATAHQNYIVYSSREGDNEFSKHSFNLYLISTQSDFVRRLTSKGVNQFPKFSQDGESILFIKNENQKSSLGIIRLNYNKSFLFPLKNGNIQSIDW